MKKFGFVVIDRSFEKEHKYEYLYTSKSTRDKKAKTFSNVPTFEIIKFEKED